MQKRNFSLSVDDFVFGWIVSPYSEPSAMAEHCGLEYPVVLVSHSEPSAMAEHCGLEYPVVLVFLTKEGAEKYAEICRSMGYRAYVHEVMLVKACKKGG